MNLMILNIYLEVLDFGMCENMLMLWCAISGG
jgi:hypothetical protein